MRRSILWTGIVVATGVVMAAAGGAAIGSPSVEPARRHFRFTYEVRLKDVPADAKQVALWIPYPTSDEWQEVRNVKVDSALPTKIETDKLNGNRVLQLTTDHAKGEPVAATMTFEVVRKEHVQRVDAVGSGKETATKADLARWLQPDSRGPLTDRIRTLAKEVTAGKTTDVEKARAIYAYVVSTMKYDKSGTGWGNGDLLWACDAKRGNCTDFHALFMGLARSVGIPARFSIGFPLPSERGQGDIPGYHCWAEFYLKGHGWIPIDASEAAKHPEKRDYFFGAHDENRVQLSVGRDLLLVPRQAGEPLNYFVYPYVEVDGKPFAGVEKSFKFADLD